VHELAIDFRALVIVAVVPDIRSAGMGADLAGSRVDPERLLGEARELLDGCHGAAIQTRAAVGDPAVVLTDVAREVGAQLLIVGRRGGDFVTRTLLGSVAQRVVQDAPCDVLVVA
jgi:nucleotide-binding universal stress UspA family protein